MIQYEINCDGNIVGVNQRSTGDELAILDCPGFPLTGKNTNTDTGEVTWYDDTSAEFTFNTHTLETISWSGAHTAGDYTALSMVGGFQVAFLAVITVCFLAAVLGWLLGLFNRDI